ncbi:MAG TPA: hypothetical protein VN721_10845 [Flavipsychrobacter sp.]|nr:hypothetical protein [Flavipsychrobacter sp.]
MNKTLLKTFAKNLKSLTASLPEKPIESNDIIDMMQEMKSHLQNASNDLLKPRQKAVDEILRKAFMCEQ